MTANVNRHQVHYLCTDVWVTEVGINPYKKSSEKGKLWQKQQGSGHEHTIAQAGTEVGSVERYIAHAALGCSVGMVKSDSVQGCAAGAAGAVVQAQNDPSNANPIALMAASAPGRTLDDGVIFLGGLVGGAAAVLAGGGKDVQGHFGLGHEAAANAIKNNRLLDTEERKRAADLAKKSGGRYTQEEIENALRNAGNRELGEDIASGMTAKSNDEVYDPGAVWRAGELGSGAIVQELPNQGRVDPELAAFIQAHTGGSTTPYYWGDVQLGKVQPPTSNPNAHLNTLQPNAKGQITAEAAAGLLPVRNPVRDIEDIRHDVADGAAVVGRGAGIVEAGSTAAAVIPGAHQPGAVATAVTAAGVGFAANVLEQIARPDQKQFFINQILIGVPADQLMKRYPMFAPVINEAAEAIKDKAGKQ